MLSKIYCDKFKSYDEPRGIIEFKPGLNTVLGGKTAENSIGKSTFLLIVDFVFGGSSFVDSDAAREIGNHTICFSFKFDDKEYHFARDIANNKAVHICDDDSYTPNGETMSLKEFTTFLNDNYKLDIPDLSFRDNAGRYMRVHGKDNVIDPKLPLSATPREHEDKAIIAFEKLFGVYEQVQSYKEAEAEAKKEKKIFTDARGIGLLPKDITSETKLKENNKRIEELEEKRLNLIKTQDVELTERQLRQTRQVEQLKKKIEELKRKHRRLVSEYNVVQSNIEGKIAPTKADIQELADFFPGANIKKLNEIEIFHHKMQEILTEEFKETGEQIKEMRDSSEKQIKILEEQLHQFDVPSNISMDFLDAYNKINSEIGYLKKQNEAFAQMKDYKDRVAEASEVRKQMEERIVADLASEVNAQMVRYNDIIYDGKTYAPVLDLKDGQNYSFHTPKDDGTGTAYKSWIVFDLSVLKLTKLPLLVHDSLLFKNIGDAPIEKILKLYMEAGKQIIISFDKNESYTPEVERITEETKVLQLDPGGNELYGYPWNVK